MGQQQTSWKRSFGVQDHLQVHGVLIPPLLSLLITLLISLLITYLGDLGGLSTVITRAISAHEPPSFLKPRRTDIKVRTDVYIFRTRSLVQVVNEAARGSPKALKTASPSYIHVCDIMCIHIYNTLWCFTVTLDP